MDRVSMRPCARAPTTTRTCTYTRAYTKVSSGMWPFPKSLLFLPWPPSPSGCVKTEGVKGRVLGGWRLGFTWLSTFVAAGQPKGNVQEGSRVCLRKEQWGRVGGSVQREMDGVEVEVCSKWGWSKNNVEPLDRRHRWGRRSPNMKLRGRAKKKKAQPHSSPFRSCATALSPLCFSAAMWLLCRVGANQCPRCPLTTPMSPMTTQWEESPSQNSKLDPSNIPLSSTFSSFFGLTASELWPSGQNLLWLAVKMLATIHRTSLMKYRLNRLFFWF